MTYEKYIENNIFKPLGMENTGFDDSRKVIKNLANGYTVWKEIINPEFVDMTNAKGAYDMYSNVSDLYLWSKALVTEKLVSKKQLDKMFSIYNGLCGYGWFLSEDTINDKHRNKFYHFGDVNGYVNYFCKYIEDDLSIILLSNFNLTPVEKISRTIAEIALGENIIISQIDELQIVDINILDKCLGTYEVEGEGNKIYISSEEDKIFITIAKMYGALYMYELIPTKIEDKKVEFMTRFIEDKVIIEISRENQLKLTHIDTNRTLTVASKSMKS